MRQRFLHQFGEKFYRWFLKKYGHKKVNEFIMFSGHLGFWSEDFAYYEFTLRKLRQIEVDPL